MKTIYSLKEFQAEIAALAELADKTYYTVRVTLHSDGIFKFDAYIDGFNWENAPTMEECVSIMRSRVVPAISKRNLDVEIEMPETFLATENL